MNIQNIIGDNLLLFTVNVWIKKPQRDEYPNIIGDNLLLFTVNVWIKKPRRDEYPKYYWE
jgi:preprotein translocase subunit Sss1